MRRIFAIWAVCLCWGILNAAPLGPFNATLLEQLKNDYQKGEKEVTRYIELQEKVAEKYIKMTPLSVTAKKKLPPSKDPRDYMTLSPYWWPDSTKIDGLPYIRKDASKQALTCHIYVIQVNHISTTSVHYQLMRLPLSLCTNKDMALLPHNIHAENVASMSLH